MIGERMASKAMINKTMIDRIEMKQKLMQWRSALVLVTMLLMLPLQMLAAELGEAGKRLAALPGVSDVEALESTTFPEKYVFFIKQQLDGKDASKGTFEQRVVLCHRGFDRPTVLVTEGYSARYALYRATSRSWLNCSTPISSLWSIATSKSRCRTPATGTI